MKKILAFGVFFVLITSCTQKTYQEREALVNALQASTEIIEEINIQSMSGFAALHAENPSKGKPIYDLAMFINDESVALEKWMQADSLTSEIILQRFDDYRTKVSERLIYDIQVPHDTIEILPNEREMKVLMANRLAAFNALVFDKIQENYWSCGPTRIFIAGKNVYTENDSTIVDLDIYFPTYKIGLTKLAVQHNQDAVAVDGTLKVDSKFGTLRFPKLAPGKYQVAGMVEFVLNNGRTTEENLYCMFEVK